MEFSIDVTPTLLLVCIIAALTLVIRLMSDVKDIRNNTKLNHHLQQMGKKAAQQKITILIDLRKQAHSIIPLIDGIYQQTDSKKEVVILIRHTAGKNAKKDLEQYRRQNNAKTIRLVTAQAGMTMLDVVKRYATGALVISLNPTQQLSKNFFSRVSLDFTVSKPDIIRLNQRTRINKTIFSAFEAYSMIWKHAFESRHNTHIDLTSLQPGVIYKRSALISNKPNKTKPVVVTSAHAHLSVAPTGLNYAFTMQRIVDKARWFQTVIGLTATLLTIGFISYVWVALTPPEVYLLLAVMIGAYLLTYAGVLSKITGYSLLDKFNLLLLSPFFLIYEGALYLIGILLPIKGAVHVLLLRTRIRK